MQSFIVRNLIQTLTRLDTDLERKKREREKKKKEKHWKFVILIIWLQTERQVTFLIHIFKKNHKQCNFILF